MTQRQNGGNDMDMGCLIVLWLVMFGILFGTDYPDEW